VLVARPRPLSRANVWIGVWILDRELKILRALGSKTRLRLVRLLLTEEICVCELEHILGISQPAISQQLTVLREAELLTARREGNWVFYQVEGPVLLEAWERVRDLLFCPLGEDVQTREDRARLRQVLEEPFSNCPDRIPKREAPLKKRCPVRIDFVCTGNSCRSQMAEYLLRSFADPARVTVQSSGVDPAGVHPLTIAVMEEIGIDLSDAESKRMDYEDLTESDLVITLCGDARERCPVTPPAVERRHWELPDPASAVGDDEQVLQEFRRVRDEIARRVRTLLGEINALSGTRVARDQ